MAELPPNPLGVVEALEFYADPQNWQDFIARPPGRDSHYHSAHAQLDKGERARQALSLTTGTASIAPAGPAAGVEDRLKADVAMLLTMVRGHVNMDRLLPGQRAAFERLSSDAMDEFRQWFERKVALEGDGEVGAGFSLSAPVPAGEGEAQDLLDALAGMLDHWAGYSLPETDAAIAAMQARGLDRWSMQAQIEAARDAGMSDFLNVPAGEGEPSGDVDRDISGETVCGFRVAAYRETHPEHGDKYGHRYSEHWSTPSQNPSVKVERLFTEDQLRAALAHPVADAPSQPDLGEHVEMVANIVRGALMGVEAARLVGKDTPDARRAIATANALDIIAALSAQPSPTQESDNAD